MQQFFPCLRASGWKTQEFAASKSSSALICGNAAFQDPVFFADVCRKRKPDLRFLRENNQRLILPGTLLHQFRNGIQQPAGIGIFRVVANFF